MAEKVEVNCEIIKIEPNPKGGQNVFVECKLGKREWVKQVWCHYNRPISMEEFIKDFSKNIWLSETEEQDDLRYVKEVAGEPFTVKVNRKSPL